ncbi:MAG: universal stress protein [Betaproteobacteria bacterium]
MKILLPVDGSPYTKKALAFLVTHEQLCGPDDELSVIHVQPPMPPRVKTLVGASAVHQYHEQEAQRVLAPIEKFLDRHHLHYKARWLLGSASHEIVKAADKEGAHMIVMGTHGHGVLGRAMMGSVAQRVVTDSPVPVLLVR